MKRGFGKGGRSKEDLEKGEGQKRIWKRGKVKKGFEKGEKLKEMKF